MSTSDYLELELYIDDFSYEALPDVYIHLNDKSLLLFSNVSASPVRLHGVWSISHSYLDREVVSLVPAEDVRYFTVLPKISDGDFND